MLKRIRASHPFLYCILAAVLFLLAMTVGLQLFLLVLVLLGPAAMGLFTQEMFLLQCVNELFGLGAGLFLLWRTGRLWVYRQRGRGFLDGLLLGMVPFVLLCQSLSFNLGVAGPAQGAPLRPLWQIAVFFLCMFLISMAEETVFRGVICQTLLEHFGPSRAGVWKACLLSGLLFGAGHLINLRASEPMGVLIQCCVTASLGMLYAAVYFRGGNLWVLIFLHTLQDTAAAIDIGLYQVNDSISGIISSYDPRMLTGVLLYLIPTAFLLRKGRIPEVAAFWRRLERPARSPEQA